MQSSSLYYILQHNAPQCGITVTPAVLIQIAVRAVESEQTKLDRVLKLLGFLHQHFSEGVVDAEVKRVMLGGLEYRFAKYDQPPLLVAYILNPHRHRAFLNPDCSFVSRRNILMLVELLYHRFFPDEPVEDSPVVDQFLAYWNKVEPFDERKSAVPDAQS